MRSRQSPQSTAFCESVQATNGSSGKAASDRGELGGARAAEGGVPRQRHCFLWRPHPCGHGKVSTVSPGVGPVELWS